MKKLQQQIITGLNNEKKVLIFINENSPNWWWWSYFSKSRKKRVYETLGIPLEDKDAAIKKAKELYIQIELGCVKMVEYSHELLYDTRHIGTFRVMSPDFHKWLKIQQHDKGGYVYVIFPSNKDTHDQNVQGVDALISDKGSFHKESLVRGKVGCSGIGKKPQKSLNDRMGTYIRAIKISSDAVIKGPGHDHKWMKTALYQNEDWCVSIFHVYAEDESKRIAYTLAVEKMVIQGVSRFLGEVPAGNLEESIDRARSNGKMPQQQETGDLSLLAETIPTRTRLMPTIGRKRN